MPVSGGAGEVVAVGADVTRVGIGDRVAVHIFPTWIDGPFDLPYAPRIGGSVDGMLADYVIVAEEALVHLPARLSFEESATLPCAALTAWNAIAGGRELRPDSRLRRSIAIRATIRELFSERAWWRRLRAKQKRSECANSG